jgi:hypothetical protein
MGVQRTRDVGSSGKGAIMKEQRKSPALAGILSTMPGLGQVYVGYYISGFIHMLVVSGIISTLSSSYGRGMEPFLGPFLAFFWLFNIIDAVRKANLYNLHSMGEREEPLPTDSPLIGGVVLLVAGALFTLRITFGLDMDWLAQVWPLALIVAGVYLVWKYRRARRELRSLPGGTSTTAFEEHRSDGVSNLR